MIHNDITRLFIVFLITISILIYSELISFSIMGLGIFIFAFTVVLVIFDFVLPQDISKSIDPKFPQGLDIFINLLKDILEFFLRKGLVIIFVIAQGYICINEYNKYIENKTLIDNGKKALAYDLFIKETYYAPANNTNYELYFSYFNIDKNETVRDIADDFGIVRDMRKKTTTQVIYYKDNAKVYDTVLYQLQPHRIIINLLFIFILISPLLLFALFITWKGNDYKISLKGITNWFRQFIDTIFSIHTLRDEYTYKNFESEFKLLAINIKENKVIRIFFSYIVINFFINSSLLYFGYFDTLKLKDTTTPINFISNSKPIKTLKRGDRYLHIYKLNDKYIVVDSSKQNPEKSYLGHIVPTYGYTFRITGEYRDNKEKLKEIVSNLHNMSLKEYSFISRFIYPYYLPFYKYDPSGTNYKLYSGFRDFQQDILKEN